MWPFNRGWPLNGGPLNRGSTVVDMISNKRKQKYSATIGWPRCRMSFASLRIAIIYNVHSWK
jgi:hypothetical protein